MDRFVLDTADPGYYLVRSTSTTVYILDLACPHPRMMRSTVPGARTGRGWWDNQWAPLVSVEAEIPDGHGIIAVGSRVRWMADPGGRTDSNEWWWISRQVTAIEKVTAEELEEFLAERDPSNEATAAETTGHEDEADATASVPEERDQARRSQLLGEMTRHAVEDGLYDATADDYTQALRHARGKDPANTPSKQHSELTAQVNAALEKSGQDEDDTAWALEMSHQRLRNLGDDWGDPPKPIATRQVVAELNAQLGATLVAALSGSRNSKAPYSWEAGSSQPDGAAETRLRVAYTLWHAVAAEESGDVARAFFIGMNPVLNDDTIITALREDRFREARAAVHVFLTDGWTA